MVERSNNTPQNKRGIKGNWVPVAEALRQIEEVEEAGGGRFAAITRRSFPMNPSGLKPRVIPCKSLDSTPSNKPNQKDA